MTAKEFSKTLRERGIDMGPEAVAKWWRRGAPRDDVEDFIEYRKTHADRDVQTCEPAPIITLLDTAREQTPPDQLINEAEAVLEAIGASDGADPIEGALQLLLARSMQELGAATDLVCILAVWLDLRLRPATIPDEVEQYHAKRLAELDLPAVLQRFGLSEHRNLFKPLEAELRRTVKAQKTP